MDPASNERRGRPSRAFLAGLSDGIGCLRAESDLDKDHASIMEEAFILWDYLLENDITLGSILGTSDFMVRMTYPEDAARKLGEATAVSAITGEPIILATRTIREVLIERFFVSDYPCIQRYLAKLNWRDRHLLSEYGEIIESGYNLPYDLDVGSLSTMGKALDEEGKDTFVLAPSPPSMISWDDRGKLCGVFLEPKQPDTDTIWQEWVLVNWVFPPDVPPLELFEIAIDR